MLDDKVIGNLKKIVRSKIKDNSYKLFIFGSRAKNVNRKFSDVDLGILGPKPVSSKAIIDIEEQFENSDIPYRIDLVDFYGATDNFKTNAMKNMISI